MEHVKIWGQEFLFDEKKCKKEFIYEVAANGESYMIGAKTMEGRIGYLMSDEPIAGLGSGMTVMVPKSEWQIQNNPKDRDEYISMAEECYALCILKEKQKLRLLGLRKDADHVGREGYQLFYQHANAEEIAGFYLKKYGNNAYVYFQEDFKDKVLHDKKKVEDILWSFYQIKEKAYYIHAYQKEYEKCILHTGSVSEAYSCFKKHANEDERAGYYLAKYGKNALDKWTQYVGPLENEKTLLVSNILGYVCSGQKNTIL